MVWRNPRSVKGWGCFVSESSPPAFPGFTRPTYTPVPDEVFDVLLPDLGKPELKVLLYVIRRTFGFGKDADAISLRQISEGITTRDGRVLDRGTGLPRSSVASATKALVERGILEVRQVRDPDGDFTSNIYSLRFVSPSGVVQSADHPSPNAGQGWSSQPTTGSRASGPPVVQSVDIQETVAQETADKNVPVSENISDPTPIAQFLPATPEERLAHFEATQATMRRMRGLG